MSKPLTDNDPMPYGIHIGTPMYDVPAKYLLWLYDNNKCNPLLKQYVEENKEVLQKELDRKYRNK